MKKELNTAAKAIAKWVEKRNQAILKAHSDDESLRAIADEADLSFSGVRKIINNHKQKGADTK